MSAHTRLIAIVIAACVAVAGCKTAGNNYGSYGKGEDYHHGGGGGGGIDKGTAIAAGAVAAVTLIAMAAASSAQPPPPQQQPPQQQPAPQTQAPAPPPPPSGPLQFKPGEQRQVNALAVNPTGSLLAMGLDNGTAPVWDLRLGREIMRLEGHATNVTAVSSSRDSQRLAVGDQNGDIRIWHPTSGRKLFDIQGQGGPVHTLFVGTRSHEVVAGGNDGKLRAWSGDNGAPLWTINAHEGPVAAIAQSSDGATFVSAGLQDGSVAVWDASTRSQKARFEGGHNGPVIFVAANESGTRVISAGLSGGVSLWDVASGFRVGGFQIGGMMLQTAAASADGTLVAVGGGDGQVRVYDAKSGERRQEFVAHNGPVKGIGFSRNGHHVFAAGVDGVTRLWDVRSGQEKVKVVSSTSGWAVTNDVGQFDGSDAGVTAVGWQTAQGAYELDQFSATHYEPGLLALYLEDRAPPTTGIVSVSSTFRPPPSVTILNEGQAGGADSLDLRVDVADQGGGVSGTRIYHNGRLMTERTPGVELLSRDESTTRAQYRYRVSLTGAQNEFQAVSANSDSIESAPSVLQISSSKSPKKPVLHLITVGINQYQNPMLNLNYGVPDAKGIAERFRNGGNDLFREVRTYQLLDGAATAENIRRQIRQLAETEPEDMIIVYLAGHGSAVDERWFFVPYDLTDPNQQSTLMAEGVSADEIGDMVPEMGAQNILFMIDSCQSGAAVASFRGFEEMKVMRRVARNNGIHIITAAGKNQNAAELANLGHGAFTYTVLEALKGYADRAPTDQQISVAELSGFVKTRVPNILADYGAVQYPISFSRGRDFTVSTTAAPTS